MNLYRDARIFNLKMTSAGALADSEPGPTTNVAEGHWQSQVGKPTRMSRCRRQAAPAGAHCAHFWTPRPCDSLALKRRHLKARRGRAVLCPTNCQCCEWQQKRSIVRTHWQLLSTAAASAAAVLATGSASESAPAAPARLKSRFLPRLSAPACVHAGCVCGQLRVRH